MTEYQEESNYNILVNDDNEILISIRAREPEPVTPLIVYAGGEHALLYHNVGLVVILDFINPGVRSLLYGAKEVLIVEFDGENIAREYMADVKPTDKLPLPDEFLPTLDDKNGLTN